VLDTCTNIQQVAEEEEEEEDGTPHVDTWRNARCGLTSLVVCINNKIRDIRGKKCDDKEWDLNYEYLIPKVSGY
jgi:hypothetical protein